AYSRVSNPSRDALERSLAALEGGSSASVFSSGCAAMHAALQLLRPGDQLVTCGDIYGGTHRLIEQLVKPMGVEVAWVDMCDLAAVKAVIGDRTKMVWIETPTNPLLRVFDIEALSGMARARGAWTVVDSTFATPMLQRPLEMGADLVVHSISKYLNGHSDVVAGVVISQRDELAERLRFIQRAGGAVPSPFDCYLVARGVKTLPIRMARHCENAQALAEWLRTQGGVTAVHYPGLPDHPEHALAAKQMSSFGGMVSFELAGGPRSAETVLERVRLFSLAESLGGVESLIGQPALMSHASMPKEFREAQGIRGGLIRLSVGLEDIEDLREDLEQALIAP
ncbi:MAG: aminotransferase class I/II-fold pyridoxal phosphate-dependent enzyme, partial [Deltaproteobacteria bacterium]|nr:aminotransferase class I/II-fold pyridoxal phosphate-dependent enzyme [Deltaproteobacteria bacterium]